MGQTVHQTRDEQITYLVHVEYADVTGPYPVGPEFALSGQFRDAATRAQDLRQKLDDLTNDEIRAQFKAQMDVDDLLRKQHQRPNHEKSEFNQFKARADFDVWAKMAHWTIDEFVALSLGRDPNIIGWDRVQRLTRVSPYAAEFELRRDICQRARESGRLKLYSSPSASLDWAEKLKFPVPPELMKAVMALRQDQTDWKAEYERSEHEAASLRQRIAILEADRPTGAAPQQIIGDKELSAKERTSLLKLVIGMAVAGYSYDPRQTRSRTTKEIADDLRIRGISLDEDTVRKYLAQAKEFLPPQETE